MPPTLTFPGVYIEEVPSGVRTITGVATSITAFVGYATRGPVNEPTLVQSFADFIRTFGGLSAKSTMSYAVQQFFQNGGSQALIVRAARTTGAGHDARAGSVDRRRRRQQGADAEAASPGEWSDNLRVRIDRNTKDEPGRRRRRSSTCSIKDVGTGVIEALRNLPPTRVASRRSSSSSRRSSASRQPADAAARRARRRQRRASDPFDPAVPARFTAFPTTGGQSGEDGDQRTTDLVPAADDGGPASTRSRAPTSSTCSASRRPAGERHERRARARRGGEGPRGALLPRPPRALHRRPAPGLDGAVDRSPAARRSCARTSRSGRTTARTRRSTSRTSGRPTRCRATSLADFPPCGRDRRRHGAHRRDARRVEGAGRARRRASTACRS